MILPTEYAHRRATLYGKLADVPGVVFLQGKGFDSSHADEDHPFRQNSNFTYLAGTNTPKAALLLVPREGRSILFAPNPSVDDRVWTGNVPSPAELRERTGVDEVRPLGDVKDVLREYAGEPIHSLPGLRGAAGRIRYAALRDALIDMRLHKSDAEVGEIERSLAITADAYEAAMRLTKPGLRETNIRAAVDAVYTLHDADHAFYTIVSTAGGNSLHQWRRGTGYLENGQLLLLDTGAAREYAGDRTRVWPVSGTFTPEQRDVYNIVLNAVGAATNAIRPGVNYREAHLRAERVIAQGLLDMGVLRGNLDDIIANGAHRMFFVHGVGHALGMDTHDLGEFKDQVAGYGPRNPRSPEFGIKSLRFARPLESGHVVTVEPGIYFNPTLLSNPELYERHAEFIDLDRARAMIATVSGIRVENNVLVTPQGHRVLRPDLPTRPEDIERIVGQNGPQFLARLLSQPSRFINS
jgi:Xaa-Pro aminopeptidase